MYDLFIYSLKSGVCLAVFYLFFKLLLSRETLHRFNRLFLLFGMVLAFALPLCVITVYRELPVVPVTVSAAVPVPTPAVPQEAAFDWRSAVGALFGIGVVAMLSWTLRSLWAVLRIVRSGEHRRLDDGVVLVVVAQAVPPFSWGRYVVVCRDDLADCGEEILVHERAHVRLCHSADLLLTDLAGALQWFNPAMWLLRRELRAIHEYEADKAVIESGADARHYQLLLIRKAVGGRWYSVANSFNHSKLKNRITMMLRKKSSRWTGVKALFVLPFAAASLGAFAQTVYVVSDGKVSKDSVTASVSGPDISLGKLDGQPLYLVDGQEVASLDGIPTEKIASIDVLKDGQAVETYGDKARNGVVAVTLKNEGDSRKSEAAAAGNVVVLRYSSDSVPSGPAPLYIVDGEETDGERLNRIDPDRIASIDIYKDAATLAAYGDKARNGVAVITLKKEGSVKADKHSVQIDDASIVVRGSSDSVSLDKVNAYFKSDEWKEAQRKIAGSQKYFESDEWKAAQEQLSQAATAGSVVSIRGTAAGNLLYLVDGVKVDDLGWIAAEQIGSMSVFKGSASVPEQYRGQGYDGVVVITTKKAATADKDWGISTSDRNSVWTHNDSVTQAKGSITITGMEQVPDDCLIFINGKRSAKADLAGIPSGKLSRMNIYKGEKAVEKFGPDAAAGVIEIKTRKW